MKKIKEFFIGKKVQRHLVSDCRFDFEKTNIFNLFNIFSNNKEFKVVCDFNKGDKSIGHLNFLITLNKNGVKNHIETSKGLIGAIARESNIIGEVFGI